jgi:hypothetical protein
MMPSCVVLKKISMATQSSMYVSRTLHICNVRKDYLMIRLADHNYMLLEPFNTSFRHCRLGMDHLSDIPES